MPSPAVFSGCVWFFINKLLKEFKLTGKCCRAASHLHHLGAEWTILCEKSNSFPSDVYTNNVTRNIALCSVLRGFSWHMAEHFTLKPGQKIQIRSAHVLLFYICTFSLMVKAMHCFHCNSTFYFWCAGTESWPWGGTQIKTQRTKRRLRRSSRSCQRLMKSCLMVCITSVCDGVFSLRSTQWKHTTLSLRWSLYFCIVFITVFPQFVFSFWNLSLSCFSKQEEYIWSLWQRGADREQRWKRSASLFKCTCNFVCLVWTLARDHIYSIFTMWSRPL